MLAVIKFFTDNIIVITSLVIFIFILLIIFSLFNNDFSDVEPKISKKKIGKVVTVESFTPAGRDNTSQADTVLPAVKLQKNTNPIVIGDLPNKSFEATFCEKYEKIPHELEAHCNNLGARECNTTGCCIFRNGIDCVAGNHMGPIFHGTQDKPIHTEYYHHKNVCHNGKGNCPS